MTAKKYFPIALFIGVQAALLQCLDQAMSANLGLVLVGGGGWISFQAWAMYFLGGCTVKGGVRAFIGYVIGMAASIVILFCGGQLGALGFWAVPLVLLISVPVILYLDIAPELINFVPAVFVGAGVFFGVMTYVPNASFATTLIGEGIYCVIGLVFGFITITFRGWYEAKFVKKETANK